MTAPKPALHLLTVDQAAERCAISRSCIERLIASGEIEAVDVRSQGNRPRLRITEAELERWIKSRALKPVKPRRSA